LQQLHFKAVSFGIDWAAYCPAELIQISRRGPQALAYLFCSLQAESFQPFLLSVGIHLCKKRLLLMVFYRHQIWVPKNLRSESLLFRGAPSSDAYLASSSSLSSSFPSSLISNSLLTGLSFSGSMVSKESF